jgi:DNA-binding NarL/FixJ family response regulator
MEPRILIVDDHEIVRDGIRNLLSRSRPSWKICGMAENGKEAIKAVEELKPDIVILDITMPVMNGLEAASRISKLGTKTRILMFTMHESNVLHDQIRQAGAQGFVSKSDAARNLILAVETILRGGTFWGNSTKPHEPVLQ